MRVHCPNLPPVAAMPHAAWSADAEILDAIQRDEVNLAIWQRRLCGALASDVSAIDMSDVEFFRFEASAEQVGREIRLAFAEAGIDCDGSALAGDVATLGGAFARIMKVERVAVRLEHVIGDACRRFHADYVTARLISTYSGPGTQWLDAGAVARLDEGIAPSRAEIRQLAVGDVGILKGRKWPGATAIVHRSPPIADSDTSRLLLVIDPAKSR